MKRTFAFALISGLVMVGLFAAQRTINASGKPGATVTYAKDIAPIIHNNCTVCHQPGEAAPMSFVSYKDVRPWAKSIRDVVVKRVMPPWYADPNHGNFVNDRRLSQKDIDTISAWVEGGAKEGDLKDLKSTPPMRQEGWSIGKPDVVFPLPEAFPVPADGTVDYQHFVVHTNFTEDKFIQAAEVMRGNASVVHHVIVSVIEPMNGKVPPEGLLRGNLAGLGENQRASENNAAARNRNNDSMLIGWAPGMSPLQLQPGLAKRIKKGSALVFQMHYTTTGTAGTDRTSIGLKFANGPIEKLFLTSGRASARELKIPAGEAHYESRSSFTFDEDSHIWGFMPHMHLRGKDFKYTLVLPDGTQKVLLNVPKYDFNWQLNYWLKEPVAAPKGSRLECVAHHDNSTNNKFNPDPTKTVYWGPQTWEEMMIGWFDYTLDKQDLRNTTASR